MQDREQIRDFLTGLREDVARTAASLPSHADYVAHYCDAATPAQAA